MVILGEMLSRNGEGDPNPIRFREHSRLDKYFMDLHKIFTPLQWHNWNVMVLLNTPYIYDYGCCR